MKNKDIGKIRSGFHKPTRPFKEKTIYDRNKAKEELKKIEEESEIIEVTLIVADKINANGNVYSEEQLIKIAEQDKKRYYIDHEGNLIGRFTKEEIEMMEIKV